MRRAVGVDEFLNKKFVCYEFEGAWADTFGQPETNFKMIIYGKSGHGKTEFCVKLAKYCCQFGKVYYNTFEQGISRSLQTSLVRNEIKEVAGLLIFGDRESVPEMIVRLKKKHSPRIVFIDSRDYLDLKTAEFKLLIDTFPHKAFVLICWESNGRPKGEPAKDMEFMCDIKCRVFNFVATPRSRYGGNKPFVIWDKPTNLPGQIEKNEEKPTQGTLF